MDKQFNILICNTHIGEQAWIWDKRKHTTIIKGMSERNTHGLLGGTVYIIISSTKSIDYRATG